MTSLEKHLTVAALVLMGAVSMAGTSHAEQPRLSETDGFGGRWIGFSEPGEENSLANTEGCRQYPKSCRVALDVIRCDAGWCGIEIDNNGTCGAVVLRFDMNRQRPHPNPNVHQFEGSLVLTKTSLMSVYLPWDKPYVAYVELGDPDPRRPPSLYLLVTMDQPSLMSRSFSYHYTAQLDRTGDAVCKVEDKTS